MPTKKFYPEPGLWVADDKAGLPNIQPPEPPPKGKISTRQLQELISYEGLGYCLYSYIHPEKITDLKLRKMWQKVRKDMHLIIERIEQVNNGPRNATVLKQKTKTGAVIGNRLL